jgi:hypothetical protein
MLCIKRAVKSWKRLNCWVGDLLWLGEISLHVCMGMHGVINSHNHKYLI